MNFSLIVPHFDDTDRLDRLLKTVPVERSDLEVIIVDDCSPNQETLEALRTRWPQVRWLSTSTNAGAGVARNIGLDAAQGRWVVFADSDDQFLSSAFETFERALQPDDELVYFLAEAVREADGNPSIRSERINELVIDYAETPNIETLQRLRLQHVVPWAKVYSLAFIEAHGLRFDPVRRSNDLAFNVLAAVQARHVRVEAIPVYRVYRRTASLTANTSAPAFMERFLVDRSLAQRLAALGIRRARSATGHMLLSVRYGPRVMLKVCCLAIFSPMLIESSRIFDLTHWWRFITTQRRDAKERAQ